MFVANASEIAHHCKKAAELFLLTSDKSQKKKKKTNYSDGYTVINPGTLSKIHNVSKCERVLLVPSCPFTAAGIHSSTSLLQIREKLNARRF